jgi:hypothetical protein
LFSLLETDKVQELPKRQGKEVTPLCRIVI